MMQNVHLVPDGLSRSLCSNAVFLSTPHLYPAMLPFFCTTRWHGITTATGFDPQAFATARTARGDPI
jgi:hypothetical protein